MARPDVVETAADLRVLTGRWRRAGERLALVPTMGALHAGHLALVDRAALAGDRVIVSIFVNPAQFAPHEDLATYPRDLAGDLERLSGRRVDLVYAPGVAEMYPEGPGTTVTVGGPSEGLESVVRPHFFAGVATVVTKLFVHCAPDVAIFGEKDFQQLAVIRRLVRDIGLPVEILACETMREPDGLAMSSRNAYLSAADRAKAPALNAALVRAVAAIEGGADPSSAIEGAKLAIENAGFAVDYLEFRDASTLGAPVRDRPGRLLAAARLGGVRLIDNRAVRSVAQMRLGPRSGTIW